MVRLPGVLLALCRPFCHEAKPPVCGLHDLIPLGAAPSTTLVQKPLIYAPEMQDTYMQRVSKAWVGPGTSPGSFAWGCLWSAILRSAQQRYLTSLAVVAVPLAQYVAWCSPTGEGSPPGNCFKLERNYISKARLKGA